MKQNIKQPVTLVLPEFPAGICSFVRDFLFVLNALCCYRRHKSKSGTWVDGKPVQIWLERLKKHGLEIGIKYDSGNWYRYDTETNSIT